MEGNCSPLLYHGSRMSQPSTSLRGSSVPEAELELLPSSPLPPGAAGSLVIGGSPSPARIPPRFLVNLLEEEAIVGEQGREKEEKEKEKEEKKLGFGCSERVL